jgi:osmotically-inducible protein OsmY
MTGVPASLDRADDDATRETPELSFGPLTGVAEQALPQEVNDNERVVPPTLVDKVRSALANTGYTLLRRLIVTTSSGSIVLSGTVPNYFLKQKAQITVMSVPGVVELRNEIVVGAGG